MTVNGYFRYSYQDERLKHDDQHVVVITDAETMKQFWEPDIFVENAQEALVHEVPSLNAYVKIQPNGDVLVSRRYVIIDKSTQ
jgi:hypothetical protein